MTLVIDTTSSGHDTTVAWVDCLGVRTLLECSAVEILISLDEPNRATVTFSDVVVNGARSS